MNNLKRTDSDDPQFRTLVQLLDKYLTITDGNEHAFYDQFNKLDSIKNVVVYLLDGEAVGCGAFKPYEDGTVEIKRMFVQPAHRGKGIAAAVLQELQKWAGELQYTVCILETGKRQSEAIRFYLKSGYSIIPNYGQYENIENSVCMKKQIR